MRLLSPLRRLAPAALVLFTLSARPAFAVSKEMIQLQTQVQQLIDSLARLQQSNDQQMGVLKDLVQQDVDAVNKMSTTVSALQLKLGSQADAQNQRIDGISGQVQSLNDSLDELKARMQRMEKSLTDLQSQAQSTNALLGSLPGANGGAPGGSAAPASSPTSAPGPGAANTPPPSTAPGGLASQPAPLASGPSANTMYRAAYSDYMAGKYNIAAAEFSDLIKAYPDDNLAGNAFFYTGELERRADKPAAAIKDYDHVLERYPDNAKIPAAHLHKGEALLAQKQTEAGIRELRALVQRFPNSPEASQARARLSAVGAPTSSRR